MPEPPSRGTPRRESDLYPPVKLHLQALGYEVRAEVGACDVIACRHTGIPPPQA